MKDSIRIAIAALFVAISIASAGAQAGKVIPLSTGEWPPYTQADAESRGFIMEIVDAVFLKMGARTELSFMPWPRAEMMARSGAVFACLPYAATDERRKEFDFSDPIASSTSKFFATRGGRIGPGLTWSSLSELKGYTIGGSRGYWYEAAFKSAELTVDYTDGDELNARKFMAGKFDLMPMDELGGWVLLRRLDPAAATKYFTVDKSLSSSELRLMVSRAWPDSAGLLKRFNAALAEMKRDGSYAAILRKYGLKP